MHCEDNSLCTLQQVLVDCKPVSDALLDRETALVNDFHLLDNSRLSRFARTYIIARFVSASWGGPMRRLSLTEQENLAFFLELFGVLFDNTVDVCGALGRFSVLGGGCTIAHDHTKALEV